MESTEMTIEQAAGQLLVVGFEGQDRQPPRAIAEALGQGQVGGVILFRRNVQDVEQVCALNTALHEAAAGALEPPFVAVDQEGGRVVRVRERLTPIPPMRAVGATHDFDLIASVSEVIATEIGALGFNLNFAPVLDVDTNPRNPVIGDRAFGEDPHHVARAAGAFLIGHLMSGVIPCGKHFPGHGDTLVDSHKGLPTVMHDPDRMERVELYPFRRAVAAGIPMLMTAHMLLPAYDALYPATLSPTLLQNLLRQEMGFDGVIITDDLEMRAVADHYAIDDMIELGLLASVDIFLICHTEAHWKRAYDKLLELAEADPEAHRRILESGERVRRLKQTFLGTLPRPWTPLEGWREVLGSAEHRQIVSRVPSSPSAGHDPTEA